MLEKIGMWLAFGGGIAMMNGVMLLIIAWNIE